VDKIAFATAPREKLPSNNNIPDFEDIDPVSSDSGGGEADVYKNGGGFIKDYRSKLNGFGMWKDSGFDKSRPATQDEFLVRVALHNKLFPSSAIKIESITKDGAITSQGALDGEQFETDDVRGILKQKGWSHLGGDSFQHTSGVIMHDADYNGATKYEEDPETGDMEPVDWEPFDVLLIPSGKPILRDSFGNIIPPSKRFDQTTDDIRYMPEKAKGTDEDVIVDKGDKNTLDVTQAIGKDGKLKFKDGKPVAATLGYNLVSAPHIKKFAGNVEDESTRFIDELPYNLKNAERKRVKALIKNGVVDNLANDMAKKTNIVLNDPAIAAGKGWYSRMRVKLLNALGEDGRELFSQLLGATSAQTPVDENFQQAVDAYEGIKKGRYNRHRRGYLTAIKAESEGKLNEEIVKSRAVEKIKSVISNLNDAIPSAKKADKLAINNEIKSLTDLIKKPVDKRTSAQRIKLYVVGNDLLPRRSNGAKFNANSGAVLKVISGVWLENLNAPKTPNFAGNLSGRTIQATIDIWAARYIRRQIYGGEGNPWRIQPKSEVGVSNEDFAFSQVIMQRAAKKLGMNPDDLQAILWFAEKDVWDKNKWTKNEGAKKSSFDDIFEVFFPEGRKPLTFKEGFDFLKKKKEQEKDIEQKEKKAIIKAEAEALGISVSALMKTKKAKRCAYKKKVKA
jgi:hypothetical protein